MQIHSIIRKLLLSSLAVMSLGAMAQETEPITQANVDICIYGSTPAGIMAAYTAKLKGKSVLLVSPTKRLGGMTAGGLGWTDIGDSTSHRRIIKGFAREFYRRIGHHYGMASPTFYFEPKVALATFRGFLNEASIKDNQDIWYEWRIVSAHKEGNDVQSIELEDGTNPKVTPHRTVNAKIFIDCSYEGDLMARAGISYTVGREPASQYGEPENGVQCLNKHQFCDGVDPYVVPGDPSSGLLWGIMPEPMGKKGEGDNHIQAYNYRLTLTKNTPFRAITDKVPDNYDPSKYELLFRWMEKKGWSGYGDCIKWTYMKDSSGPNSWNAVKTDNNNNGGFSTDMIGYSWDYPEATYEQRDSIAKLHEDYTKGLLYILWTDKRVPASIQAEFLKWGYPLDEYEDNENFTPQLYVREARRMLGRMVMTEDYCLKTKAVDDPIAWGAYTMDSHNCGRYVVNGMVKNEGDVQRHLTAGPYGISYRAVTPKEEEARNVIVPVCLSASHIAYGSIRMEPVYMVLGETTALAAIQAIDEHEGCVQEVDPAKCIKQLENGLEVERFEELPAEGNSVAVDITNRVLQNPSFETAYTNTSKPPYGWSELPAGTTLQRSLSTNPNNMDGKKAYVCKPESGKTINEPLKLYQRIPAEKLGAGIYKVTCKMWIEKDYYGTACLFADNGEGTNCNVQYWTTEAYYRNGTSGYDNINYTDYRTTFANHAGGFNNTTTQNMQRMVVYITLRDGDDMMVGIRTNSANQASDKAGAGYFIVDDFRVEKLTEKPLSQEAFCDKNLINYTFEKDPQGNTYDWNVKATKNESANGPILGWLCYPEWTDNYGGVSDGTNLEWKWAGYVASTSGVIPNDFKLYQTIPAENLTPGVYEVNARMWLHQSKLGITRLYGAAGDKCSVQYYGKADKYPQNVLTDGEVATFANLTACTTTGRVNEMSLDVEVGEGKNLEVGVKAGYGAEANNTPGANYGKFYVDLLRTWKVSDLPVEYAETASDNVILPQTYTNKVILNKTFSNGEWQDVCFPFSLNKSDIETIFGKGTEVMGMEIAQPDCLCPDELGFYGVSEMEAGLPYRIRPTDVLPSPITLENVRIETSEPKDVSTSGYTLKGVFQATEDVPAFGVINIQHGINTSILSPQTEQEEDASYDLSGRRTTSTAKGVVIHKGNKFLN